jgi:hypothetical protein
MRNRARLASYLAAGRLLSEPCIMATPSVLHTDHRHFRPRVLKTISKVGSWSAMGNGLQGVIVHNKAYKG